MNPLHKTRTKRTQRRPDLPKGCLRENLLIEGVSEQHR